MTQAIKEYGTCNLCSSAFWKKDLIKVRHLSGFSFKDEDKPEVFICKSCCKKLDSPVGAPPRECRSPDDWLSGPPI